jgi:hypothetical protein
MIMSTMAPACDVSHLQKVAAAGGASMHGLKHAIGRRRCGEAERQCE